MVRAKGSREHLPGLIKVSQVGSRITPADHTVTFLIKRTHIASKPGVPDVEPPTAGKDLAIARVACRHYAVEHIDTARDRLDQIDRGSYSHQVARPVGWHERRGEFDRIIHQGLLLPDAQSTDSIPLEPNCDKLFKTLTAQVIVNAALYDPKQRRGDSRGCRRLPEPIEFETRANSPACRQIERFEGLTMCCRPWGTLIETHHDVGTEGVLHLHRDLRREKFQRAVKMRAKLDPLLPDLS